MTYLARPLPFPKRVTDGYPAIADEPVFDAAKHLQIERPETVTRLAEFGYPASEIARCPTDLAVTSTFRVLSDEGAACLIDVARKLEPHARGIERISRMVRGGTYPSRFLRDLCMAPELTEAVSEICGAPLLPHTIPHQLGHLNYAPRDVGENVDKWHVDTLRIDFVMFVTDPNAVEGGEFEYFAGTKDEVAAFKAAGQPLPRDRVRQAALPGPGYAVLQQGNLVVHRACGLRAPGERITMVNGYVAADVDAEDHCRFDQLRLADPPHVVASEYARHVAWRGREMLAREIEAMAFGADRAAMAALLNGAATELRSEEVAAMEHFGDA